MTRAMVFFTLLIEVRCFMRVSHRADINSENDIIHVIFLFYTKIMSAVRPTTLSKYIGQLWVRDNSVGGSYRRMGSVRGLLSRITMEEADIKADDTGTVINSTKPVIRVECTFLEVFDPNLVDIILPGTRSNVAASPVSVTGEALGTGWTVGQPIKLANKNGDNTTVTSIVIDEDGTPLVDGTDYDTYVATAADDNGDPGYTYIVPLTASSGVLDADYDYTPNASSSFVITKEAQELPTLDVYITGTDSSGNEIRITLTDCNFTGDYVQEFIDYVEAGDINGSTIAFDLNDGGTYEYYDEVNDDLA